MNRAEGSEFWLTVTLEKTTIAVLEKPAATLWSGWKRSRWVCASCWLRTIVINQEVACGFLEMWGCRVDMWSATAGSPAARPGSRHYDLALMDIQMPEMDGRQATAEIRARERTSGRHLPIIAMTAHNMQGDREQCLACGMDDYVSKPVDPDELLAALKRWGDVAASAAKALPSAPPSAAQASLPVLDIERLHRSCAGKAKLERRIMMETLRLTPELLSRLVGAVGAADAETCRFEAHTLKGSSRTLGAEALGAAASNLEEAAKTGVLNGAAELLQMIESEWAALSVLLDECLTQEPWKSAL